MPHLTGEAFFLLTQMKSILKYLLSISFLLSSPKLALSDQTHKKDKLKSNNKLNEQEIAEGWKLLFNGKDLSNWRYYNSPTKKITGWTIDNGNLHKPKGIKAGNIMTDKTYENFIFSWEWKLENNGNNGVKYFITEKRQATIGHEYQMIDDKRVKDPYSSNGSFYLIVKPIKNKPNLSMGSWNQSKIIVKGNHVEHWLNGIKILSYSCGSKEVMERVPKTKFKNVWKFGEKITGHILLTDHTDACWYRNVKIKDLK